MNDKDVRKALSEPDRIASQAFTILQGIARYVNDSAMEDRGRELVLRALEHREKFGKLAKVLDGLTREVGLFPYLEIDELSLRDAIAYEFHKPEKDPDFVFHRAQAEVYRRLMDGESVILSAPTSFGKSRIIDAIIASEKYANLAIVVPTIALIDETRRRLSDFSDRFKVVSQLSQRPDERNIFVFTAERLNAYEELPKIDFFVIDEFYKIGLPRDKEPDRAVALNQAFYRLHKGGSQFYLLGPSIRSVPEGIEKNLQCGFVLTNFSTVASDVVNAFPCKDKLAKLIEICSPIDEPTLIFCSSPKRVYEVANALLDAGIGIKTPEMSDAAQWIGEQFHEDWVYSKSLQRGIGLHHGRLPRSIGQLSVRSFNEKKLLFLICTSTLIEGVNTCAKNVIVFDHKINRKTLDFFTFNNIKGRSGRMFEHFVGQIFLFHPPPQEDLPFVDFPTITQGDEVPNSLLVQIESDDLTDRAKERLSEVFNQEILPLNIIRQNSTLDPTMQIDLANEISRYSRSEAENLWWSSMPTYEQLEFATTLMWRFFVRKSKNEVYSARQLAWKVWNLYQTPNIRTRILEELGPGKYKTRLVDEAVDKVFIFDRNWASFEFPRLLIALSRIQGHVFNLKFRRTGNFSFFAAKVEQLFRNPALIALEEYGLPLQVGEKISQYVELSEDIDVAISRISEINISDLMLNDFELEVLEYVQKNL